MKRRSFIHNTCGAGLACALGSLSCNRSLDAEFIILGAGLSGLYLAHLMDKAGKDYVVLEGSNRVGGRLFTRTDFGADVGGRGIGDKYIEAMKLLKEFDVDLVDITAAFREPTGLYYKGEYIEKWTDPKTNPMLQERNALKRANVTLENLSAWYQQDSLDIPYADLFKNADVSSTSLDVININANYNDIYKTSALNALHSAAFRKYNGSKKIFNIKHGSSTLTDKISASLKRPVQLNKMVKSIRDNMQHIQVTCADGSVYKAKKAISSLPFSTMRDVRLNIDSNSKQKKLINELGYTKITQIHLKPTAAFWEVDQQPISMWTDSPIERIMNFNTTAPGSHLVCWVNGDGADAIDSISESEVSRLALNTLKKLRPSTEGKIEYIGRHSWAKYPFNKGAYAEFYPGQVSSFKQMIEPAGNLFFAGEHTALESRGIEGAAASAKRVYSELFLKNS